MPHSAENMFNLVNNIALYPEFLPWCEYSRVHRLNEDEVRATLGIKHGMVRKSFTTNNRLHPHKMIQMKLFKGPFSHLDGYWRFESLGEAGSRISLDLEFELATPVLSFTLGPVFNRIAKTLVEAFCQRADAYYG